MQAALNQEEQKQLSNSHLLLLSMAKAAFAWARTCSCLRSKGRVHATHSLPVSWFTFLSGHLVSSSIKLTFTPCFHLPTKPSTAISTTSSELQQHFYPKRSALWTLFLTRMVLNPVRTTALHHRKKISHGPGQDAQAQFALAPRRTAHEQFTLWSGQTAQVQPGVELHLHNSLCSRGETVQVWSGC